MSVDSSLQLHSTFKQQVALLSSVILFVFCPAVTFAGDPPFDIEGINVDTAIYPNPAFVSQQASGKVRLHLYAKGTQNEIPPLSRVKTNFSFTSVSKNGVQVNPIPNNVNFDPWVLNPSGDGMTTVSIDDGFVDPGTYTIVVHAKLQDPSTPQKWGPIETNANQDCSLTFTVVAAPNVQITAVSYTSDHHAMTYFDDNYTSSDDPTNVILAPEWDKIHQAPISETKGTSPSLTLKVNLGQGAPVGQYTLSADDYDPQQVNLQAGDNSVNFTVKQSSKLLPNNVAYLLNSENWKIKDPNGNITNLPITQEMLATWGTVKKLQTGDSTATRHRLTWATKAANGGDTEEHMADKIQAAVRSDTDFSGTGRIADWQLLDEGLGSCYNQATLMADAINLLGGAAGLARVMASTQGGVKNCLQLQKRNGDAEWLVLDFNGNGQLGDNWNIFEGCCVTADHFYSTNPGNKATNDYTMLQTLGKGGVKQFWCQVQVEAMSGSWKVTQVEEQVPVP